MKYIKKYEDNTIYKPVFRMPPPKFKVGDIVVAIKTQYANRTNWLMRGTAHVVLSVNEVAPVYKTHFSSPWVIQIQQVRYSTLKPISNSNFGETWFDENNFISLEEYEFIQKQKKFNL